MTASKCKKVTKCNEKLWAAGKVVEKTSKPLESCIKSKCHGRFELMEKITKNDKNAISSSDKHRLSAECGAVHCSKEGVKYGKVLKSWNARSKRCNLIE
jgi:hypothetical protein